VVPLKEKFAIVKNEYYYIYKHLKKNKVFKAMFILYIIHTY